MHLVVLLLSRHSPHWNSISSQQFFVSPNLYSPYNTLFPIFFFLNMMHEGQLSMEHLWLLTWISTFELDNLIIIQALTAKVAWQGKCINYTSLSLRTLSYDNICLFTILKNINRNQKIFFFLFLTLWRVMMVPLKGCKIIAGYEGNNLTGGIMSNQWICKPQIQTRNNIYLPDLCSCWYIFGCVPLRLHQLRKRQIAACRYPHHLYDRTSSQRVSSAVKMPHTIHFHNISSQRIRSVPCFTPINHH